MTPFGQLDYALGRKGTAAAYHTNSLALRLATKLAAHLASYRVPSRRTGGRRALSGFSSFPSAH